MNNRAEREAEETFGDNKPSRDNPLKRIVKTLSSDEQTKEMFCFNLFTNDVEHFDDNILLSHTAKKGTVVNDLDISCIRNYLSQKYNFSPTKVNLDDAVVHLAMQRSYHPIKEYLETLTWDKQPRLDNWLHQICGAPFNEYTQAVGRKLFVAAVKRIYEPGCYYAQLVIIEGKQRIFKSRLVKDIGADWYASIHLKTHDSKQVVEEMRGKWILEIEELAGFSKQDTEHMKAFVSRQTDRVRLSYGRRAMDFPRQSIMIATMNPEDGDNKYLLDTTGNVRYWPIKCGEGNIKIDAFNDCRDQLYAEAVVLYKDGETLWLNSAAENILAEREQEERMVKDTWTNTIMDWLEDKERSLVKHKVTSEMIAEECFDIPKERYNQRTWTRIGAIMAKSGWIKERGTKRDDRSYYYVPPKVKDKVNWEE